MCPNTRATHLNWFLLFFSGLFAKNCFSLTRTFSFAKKIFCKKFFPDTKKCICRLPNAGGFNTFLTFGPRPCKLIYHGSGKFLIQCQNIQSKKWMAHWDGLPSRQLDCVAAFLPYLTLPYLTYLTLNLTLLTLLLILLNTFTFLASTSTSLQLEQDSPLSIMSLIIQNNRTIFISFSPQVPGLVSSLILFKSIIWFIKIQNRCNGTGRVNSPKKNKQWCQGRCGWTEARLSDSVAVTVVRRKDAALGSDKPFFVCVFPRFLPGNTWKPPGVDHFRKMHRRNQENVQKVSGMPRRKCLNFWSKKEIVCRNNDNHWGCEE